MAPDILPMYRKYYPEKSPYLVQAQIFTDAGFRRSAFKQAELKAAQGNGAIYMYEWDWPTPAFGGRYGAVHGLDVSGSFREAREGNDMARVADQLSSAWVAFAKTGNPNNSRIPPWSTYQRADPRDHAVRDADATGQRSARRDAQVLGADATARRPDWDDL